jgi:L-asparaginase
MQSTVVILGTGGTIAGQAARADDALGYRAGSLGVDALLAAVPPLAGRALETEQVAQLDSKDMDMATWQRLAQRVAHHLARPEVAGVVVTHGTDTLEETAWFLHRVLAPKKPLVLTAAMRPATALGADGPQNLLDAVTLAAAPGARGTMAVLAGAAHAAADLRKRHTLRVDAFDGGDAGPVARLDGGRLRCFRPWPDGDALGLRTVASDPVHWPWVAVVASHAGADGREVRALVGAGVQGLVIAGTGNGTLAAPLAAALEHAQRAGVVVCRASRCGSGPVLDPDPAASTSLASGDLSPWQARVDLLLALLVARADRSAAGQQQ